MTEVGLPVSCCAALLAGLLDWGVDGDQLWSLVSRRTRRARRDASLAGLQLLQLLDSE